MQEFYQPVTHFQTQHEISLKNCAKFITGHQFLVRKYPNGHIHPSLMGEKFYSKN